jgi:hypothetical protein
MNMAGWMRSIDKWLRRGVRPLVRRLTRAAGLQIEAQRVVIAELKEANLRTRAAVKRRSGQPIRVVFACHGRSMWGLFESVYAEARNDPELQPVVVALPYRHSTLPAGQYHDECVAEFLRSLGVPVVEAVDTRTGTWLEPRELEADYIFFQTPYRLYHESWSVERASVHSRVCYIPYGCTLFSGDVDNVSHPEAFFRHVSLTFTENPHGQRLFEGKFGKAQWFRPSSFVLTGYPKLDRMQANGPIPRGVWKRPPGEAEIRILWTPRWRTEEGNCHFFDYEEVLVDFCRDRSDRELAFRPHPLCLQNFVKTGELSVAQVETLRDTYREAPNMVLDETGEYRGTFLSSCVLVSDVSSMMFEYFATGKPIVYTHRVDVFNELGRTLAEGFYWVRNAGELRQTLERLQRGDDPLAGKRMELIDKVVRMSPDSAGRAIVRALKLDFHADVLAERLAAAQAVDAQGLAASAAQESAEPLRTAQAKDATARSHTNVA